MSRQSYFFLVPSLEIAYTIKNVQESRKISSPFIKPNPKPRGVVRSHTVAAASPYVASYQNGSQNSSPDAKPRKVSKTGPWFNIIKSSCFKLFRFVCNCYIL